jgi:hypothetical protein
MIRTINRTVLGTHERTIKRMTVITANDLKTKDVANIGELLQSAYAPLQLHTAA